MFIQRYFDCEIQHIDGFKCHLSKYEKMREGNEVLFGGCGYYKH